MTTAWFIYGLTAPESSRIRYVGFTRNPHNRRLQHISKARNMARHPLYDWVRSLLRRGEELRMVILQEGRGEGWQQAEQEWIGEFLKTGLFNISPGGEIPAIPPESRKRAGEKLRTRIFTPEHRARISESKKGKPRPDFAERNRASAHLRVGKKMSYTEAGMAAKREHGRKMGTANGRKKWDSMTLEERERVSQRASEQMKRVWAERKEARRG